MVRDVRAHLWDMQEACERISRYTRVATLDGYMVDDQLRSAVERQLGILGEALNQLSKFDPVLGSRIPGHRQMIAFRNVLVHGYMTLDHPRVWNQVATSIPDLNKVIDQLLAELGPPLAAP